MTLYHGYNKELEILDKIESAYPETSGDCKILRQAIWTLIWAGVPKSGGVYPSYVKAKINTEPINVGDK